MRRLQKAIVSISSSTLSALRSYDWPGNVRELENMIERSVILSPGAELIVPPGALETSSHPLHTCGPVDHVARIAAHHPRTLAEAERLFIVAALEETGWTVGGPTGAASRLGLTRTTLQGRMRKLGISRPALNRAAAPSATSSRSAT